MHPTVSYNGSSGQLDLHKLCKMLEMLMMQLVWCQGDKGQMDKGQGVTLKSPPSPETCQKSKFRHESHNRTSETSRVVLLITCSEYKWRRRFVLHLLISSVLCGKSSLLCYNASSVCRSAASHSEQNHLHVQHLALHGVLSYHRSLQFGVIFVLQNHRRLFCRVQDDCRMNLLAVELCTTRYTVVIISEMSEKHLQSAKGIQMRAEIHSNRVIDVL